MIGQPSRLVVARDEHAQDSESAYHKGNYGPSVAEEPGDRIAGTELRPEKPADIAVLTLLHHSGARVANSVPKQATARVQVSRERPLSRRASPRAECTFSRDLWRSRRRTNPEPYSRRSFRNEATAISSTTTER